MRQPHLRLRLSSGVSISGLVSFVLGEGGLGGTQHGVVSEDGSWVGLEDASWAESGDAAS